MVLFQSAKPAVHGHRQIQLRQLYQEAKSLHVGHARECKIDVGHS